MGAALAQAQSWFVQRAEDLPKVDREFIALSIERGRKAQARARHVRALVYVLLVGIIVGLIGWINQLYIKEQWTWYTIDRPFVASNIWPCVLTPAAEQALQPKDSFRECAPARQDEDYCPDMLVVPAGSSMMGSLRTDKDALANEVPQHQVTIVEPFAVSKFELAFDEWDTCVAYGDCPQGVTDNGLGRGRQPVFNVTWDDAQRYVAWLSKMTGKTYRLLSEAEYEYATRAGTTTIYPWGDEIGKNNAACISCGSKWDTDKKQTRPAPVGSFAANRFGLHDMVGNVWEWVEDCYHDNYSGAPANGSAWTGGDCSRRVMRGGSWRDNPVFLRSASRARLPSDFRTNILGFRVARTLFAKAGEITVVPGVR